MLPLFPSPSFSVISQLEDNFKSVDQITRLLLLNFLMASLCTENKTHICFHVADNGSLGYNSPCNFSSLPRLFQSAASTKPFLHHAVPCARECSFYLLLSGSHFSWGHSTSANSLERFFLSKTGSLTYHLIHSLSIIPCHGISFSLKHNNK